jgi:hypothetical protein
MRSAVNTNNICNFCSQNHKCRSCPTEKKIRSRVSKKVGITMEEFVVTNIPCKYCEQKSFVRLASSTPSLDLQCTNCKQNVEVKSKCLSTNNLPNDIICKGGNYDCFVDNINNKNLNLLLVVYGVNRINKSIFIREVFWINNDDLVLQKNIKITERDKLSTIFIPDKNNFSKLEFDTMPTISFNNWIQKLIKKGE